MEFSRRILSNSLGIEVWMVSLEDLNLSKFLWIQQLKSEKQMDDIKNLLTNPSLDKAYLSKWCAELGLKTYNLYQP
jgi:hypothetical protein